PECRFGIVVRKGDFKKMSRDVIEPSGRIRVAARSALCLLELVTRLLKHALELGGRNLATEKFGTCFDALADPFSHNVTALLGVDGAPTEHLCSFCEFTCLKINVPQFILQPATLFR